MNTKLPMKEEKGVLNKIKNFFKKIFHHRNSKKNIEEESFANNVNTVEEATFQDDIKFNIEQSDLQKRIARDEMFIKIRKNPELIN